MNKTNVSRKVTSNRILAQDLVVTNNTWETNLNNNDLVVGPSGASKTRSYVKPNILHSNDSLIVTDTKGNLFRLYEQHLKKKGYKVMCLDFTDTSDSPYGYNPLDYIRENEDEEWNEKGDYYCEQDIKKLAKALCPLQTRNDPFWDFAAQDYLETIILYIMNVLPEEEHTLYMAYKLLGDMETDEGKELFRQECDIHPESSFALKYKMISQNALAEKMHASIKGILAQHLDVVSYSGTKHMFEMEPQADLGSFLKQKTALFLNVSDSDRSQDNLVNLFYTQALQYLMCAADKQPDSRLPIPVRFILDDFSTNTLIPDFDKIISVIRSREIYVSVIIQSISQLEGLYEKAKAQTIINNCDQCLYLGGTDVETARYFALKFNCQASTILNLPLDDMYLFRRGSSPVKVTKYNLSEDKLYQEIELGKNNKDMGQDLT